MSPSRHSICIHVLLRSIPLPGQKHEFNYSNVTRISVQIIFHLIKLPPRITWIQPPTYLSSWIDDTIYVKHALFTVMEWKYLYPFLSLSLSPWSACHPSIHPSILTLARWSSRVSMNDWVTDFLLLFIKIISWIYLNYRQGFSHRHSFL